MALNCIEYDACPKCQGELGKSDEDGFLNFITLASCYDCGYSFGYVARVDKR